MTGSGHVVARPARLSQPTRRTKLVQKFPIFAAPAVEREPLDLVEAINVGEGVTEAPLAIVMHLGRRPHTLADLLLHNWHPYGGSTLPGVRTTWTAVAR